MLLLLLLLPTAAAAVTRAPSSSSSRAVFLVLTPDGQILHMEETSFFHGVVFIQFGRLRSIVPPRLIISCK